MARISPIDVDQLARCPTPLAQSMTYEDAMKQVQPAEPSPFEPSPSFVSRISPTIIKTKLLPGKITVLRDKHIVVYEHLEQHPPFVSPGQGVITTHINITHNGILNEIKNNYDKGNIYIGRTPGIGVVSDMMRADFISTAFFKAPVYTHDIINKPDSEVENWMLVPRNGDNNGYYLVRVARVVLIGQEQPEPVNLSRDLAPYTREAYARALTLRDCYNDGSAPPLSWDPVSSFLPNTKPMISPKAGPMGMVSLVYKEHAPPLTTSQQAYFLEMEMYRISSSKPVNLLNRTKARNEIDTGRSHCVQSKLNGSNKIAINSGNFDDHDDDEDEDPVVINNNDECKDCGGKVCLRGKNCVMHNTVYFELGPAFELRI